MRAHTFQSPLEHHPDRCGFFFVDDPFPQGAVVVVPVQAYAAGGGHAAVPGSLFLAAHSAFHELEPLPLRCVSQDVGPQLTFWSSVRWLPDEFKADACFNAHPLDVEQVQRVPGETVVVVDNHDVNFPALDSFEETGEPFKVPCCPVCTAQIVDKDGVPLTDEDLSRRKRVCAHCGSPLWQADNSGPRRYPLADYVKHHMKGFFDLLVGDEVHEYKGRGSAQGIAAGVLADVCGKALSLSGTLMGGYSSTLFHLLYRFSPEIRTDFGRSDEHRWIQRYGFEEHTVGKPDDDSVEDGRFSRRRKYRKVVRERPGLVPSALFHIIGNTVFLRLADVASGLPPYEEQVMLSSMDSEEDATGYSQRSAYNTVYEELRLKLAEALKAGSKRLLATYLQTLLAYPDGCTRGETVSTPGAGR